jgi:hypothetical protein
VTAWITFLVFALATLAWMWLLEHRTAYLLDLAEATCDQADRALAFITDHAAPAIERIAAIAPELADVLVTHRTFVAGLGTPPVVVEVVEPHQEEPMPDQPADTVPNLPAQKPRRPKPRPTPTVPDNVAVAAGTQAAEDAANGQEDAFMVAYRAELDRQVAEWRQSIEERA